MIKDGIPTDMEKDLKKNNMSEVGKLLRDAKAHHNAHSIDCLIEAVKILSQVQCSIIAISDDLSQTQRTELINRIYVE
jgi:hypothetical protein